MLSKAAGVLRGRVSGSPREEDSLPGMMAPRELRRRRRRNLWPSWRKQLPAALLALVCLLGWSHGRMLKEQDGLPRAQVADSEWNRLAVSAEDSSSSAMASLAAAQAAAEAATARTQSLHQFAPAAVSPIFRTLHRIFPSNITGTYKGTWEVVENQTSLPIPDLKKMSGNIIFQIRASETSRRGIHFLQGEVVLRDGMYISDSDVHMRLEGVYVKTWGELRMVLSSGMDSDLDWEGGVGPSSTPYHLAFQDAGPGRARGANQGTILEMSKTCRVRMVAHVSPTEWDWKSTFSDGVREHAPSKIQGLLESPWDETRALEHASERRRLLEQLEGELQDQEHLEDGILDDQPLREGGIQEGGLRHTQEQVQGQAGMSLGEGGVQELGEEEGGTGVSLFGDSFDEAGRVMVYDGQLGSQGASGGSQAGQGLPSSAAFPLKTPYRISPQRLGAAVQALNSGRVGSDIHSDAHSGLHRSHLHSVHMHRHSYSHSHIHSHSDSHSHGHGHIHSHSHSHSYRHRHRGVLGELQLARNERIDRRRALIRSLRLSEMEMDGGEHPPCFATLRINATAVDLDAFYNKAVNYTLLVTFVSFLQVLFIIRQMEHSNTQSGAAKVSMLMVGQQAIMDAYLCLLHLTAGIVVESLFNAFATAAFFKFVIFSIFEMRYLLAIWKARRPSSSADSWDAMRRELSVLYSRFYGFLLGGILLLYKFHSVLRYMLLIFYSFWVPQIVTSVIRDSRKPLHLYYILGMSATRLAVPLYVFGCPRNFMRIEPNYHWCAALVCLMGAQVTVLLLQHFFGPRCFIPRQFLPEKYCYFRRLDCATRFRECAGSQEDGCLPDCVICMAPVQASQLGTDHMVTPCDHIFHARCLQRWMDIKMECPTCRRSLPPL